MHYERVAIESFGYVLPDEIVTSDEIESRLDPLYQRLGLPQGRLQLMSGIEQRRFWPPGTLPSDISVKSCRLALEAADVSVDDVGLLVHGSVCRDYLEPATACTVHHHLNLPASTMIYDVSNACLGIMNGIIQAANMIELGQTRAALVVGTEGGRQLVETTIDMLNQSEHLSRQQIKPAVASLTIGSASCAVLLVHRDISSTDNRLYSAVTRANTRFHDLCRSDHDQAGENMQPLMNTDAEELMNNGVETGRQAFEDFLAESKWDRADIDHTFSHQVGSAHRKLMIEKLGLSEPRDFTTLPWLGNTGSTALPSTMAIALEQGRVQPDDRVAMMGIGSGINCIILGAVWQKSLVGSRGNQLAAAST